LALCQFSIDVADLARYIKTLKYSFDVSSYIFLIHSIMADINKIPDSPESISPPEINNPVIINPSNLSIPDSKEAEQKIENIENEIFFLTFPRTCFQLYACKSCHERMINCSINENIKDIEDGHKIISFKFCPSCIRENLRIFHIIKGM